MARRRGLTQEEIVKLMQELSDCDSGSEIDKTTNKEDKEGNESSSDSEFVVAIDHAISSSSSSESENELPPMNSNADITKNTKGTSRCSKSNKKFNITQPAICKETASDGTVWTVENTSNTSGRRPLQNILRENAGPTTYAKRHICSDKPLSAWSALNVAQTNSPVSKILIFSFFLKGSFPKIFKCLG
jgi:hypothetical protein